MSAKRTITFGNILDLLDVNREGCNTILLVGAEDEIEDGVSGKTSSEIWEPWLDWPVESLDIDEGPGDLIICLAQKEADHDAE